MVVAVLLAYGPGIKAPLVFDDWFAIGNNASIRQLWPLSIPFSPPRDTPVSGRPISNYSLALDYAVNTRMGIGADSADPSKKYPTVSNEYAGTFETVSYHLTNIAIHLWCGLLLFGIIRRTLASPRITTWSAAGGWSATGVAALVSAVWLLHPIQSEAVNYLTQRTELVVALFYLGTLYGSIRAWDATSPKERWGWYAAAVAACLLGMGSKEVMVSAPMMVLLYDRAFRLDSWGEAKQRSGFYASLALTLVWLAVLVAGAPRAATAGFHLGIPWYSYLYSQAWAILRYVELVFVPNRLMLDYGSKPITGWAGVPGVIVLTTFAAATIAAWTRPKEWGWFGFLGAWFFMILAPSSSVVPIITEIAAERRFYLPLAAVLVLILVGAETLRRRMSRAAARPGRRRWMAPAAIAACLLLTAATRERSHLYTDPEALWREVTERLPDNPRAWESRGIALWYKDSSQHVEAESLIRKAIALDSNYGTAYLNLAEIARSEGRLSDAKQWLTHSLKIDSLDTGTHRRLGVLLFDLNEIPQSIVELERATSGGNNQAAVDLAKAYLAAGRTADAIRAFRTALDADPDRLAVLLSLVRLLVEQGKADEAVPYLNRVAAQPSLSAFSAGILAYGYARSNRPEAATRFATQAAAQSNGDARTLVFAGRAMALTNHLREAETDLTESVRLDGSDPEALTALGTVKAAGGDRAAAAALFQQALKVDPGYVPASAALARLGSRPQ